MSIPSGGHNPTHGLDPGPPPPIAHLTGAPPPPDVGPPPPGTTRTMAMPMTVPMPMPMGMPMPMPVPPPSYYPMPGAPAGQPPMMYYCHPGLPPPPPPPPPYAPTAPPGLATTLALDAQGLLYQYISGFNGSARFPQPPPVIDPDFPAANLINSTGGVGAEPGVNYFFPTEHAKVVVLKCTTPPWHLVPGDYGAIPFHCCNVPANITMAELLVGFGADNPDKGKNQFWEVYEQGGGKWGWKEHCKGDDPVMMARTVRDMGWVEKREGVQRTVYLWVHKGE
ncbi:hypothetical protein VTI74DRAFT_6506 [Chaetomium olivicolor]